MYVRPTSTRLLSGMLIPAIRAMSLLALPLLVPWVLTDHEDRAVAADDLALLAHRLARRSYLHDPFRLASSSAPALAAARGRRYPVADVRRSAQAHRRNTIAGGLPAPRDAVDPVSTACFQLSRSPTTDPVRDISM